MEVKAPARTASHEWPEVIVEELKSPADNALATGPFGSSIGSRFFEKHGVPLIRGSNLSTDGRTQFIDNGLVFVSEAKASEFRRSIVTKGDLVFTCWGTINQVGLIGAHCAYDRYIISNKQMKFTPDRNKADSLFLFYLFSSPAIQRTIINQSIGSSVPGFNLGQLRAMRLRIPPLPEQRAIAGALSDVDALIGALDWLIAKKRDLKQAAMQQLLTGQKRLPGFHGEWETLNMSEKATLKARIGWQGLTTAEYLKSGEYYLVTGTDFANGRVDWSSCCFVASERYVQDRNIQLRPKDILLTKDGTIGKVGFINELPGPTTLNSGVFVIRPKDDAFDPQFFYFVLTSRIFDDFLTKLQAGSTISHLYQKDFVNFSFLAPATVDEQTVIAEVLSDMDAELAALEQRRDKTRALKQGMMQELLTGRTRLVDSPRSYD